MIITKKYLLDWEKSARIHITDEQKQLILDRFGTEPEPCEWTDQDIAVQIQNFLGCGEFVKTSEYCGEYSTLPDGVEF
jgi:hypothetical protein